MFIYTNRLTYVSVEIISFPQLYVLDPVWPQFRDGTDYMDGQQTLTIAPEFLD